MIKQKPFISIIVPVYNDPERIQILLESLIAQNYSKENYEKEKNRNLVFA